MATLGVLTSSDLGAQGRREDTSGKLIQQLLAPPAYHLRQYIIVPDEAAIIQEHLVRWSDVDRLDLIVTTGGTGLTERDVMPEATLAVVQRLVPGMAEAMRAYGLQKTPMAMISRGVVGVRGKTLIINLPGSPKGVQDGIDAIIKVLPHSLELIKGAAQGHPA